jgi:hypothetical protein
VLKACELLKQSGHVLVWSVGAASTIFSYSAVAQTVSGNFHIESAKHNDTHVLIFDWNPATGAFKAKLVNWSDYINFRTDASVLTESNKGDPPPVQVVADIRNTTDLKCTTSRS